MGVGGKWCDPEKGEHAGLRRPPRQHTFASGGGKHKMTPTRLPRRVGFVRLLAAVCLLLPFGRDVRGQCAVEVEINPSPMIARGHLEGGINGEGASRPDGKTPLMLAVEARDAQVIDYLLAHGADPFMKDAAGGTALELARRVDADAFKKLAADQSQHSSPEVYYLGRPPVLSVTSARAQSGSPGYAAAHSLVVAVLDRDGKPMVDAPVRFTVEGGGSHLLTQPSSPASPSLLLRTDAEGRCAANVRLPKTPDTAIHVAASAGVGEGIVSTTFTLLTNDGTGGASDVFYRVSNLYSQGNGDGSLDMSWQNHTDDETSIKILIRMPSGWKVVRTLRPHENSIHLPQDLGL